MKLLAILFLYIPMGVYAQVRITNDGDVLKGSIKRITEYETGRCCISGDTMKSIYTWDTANSLEIISFYDELEKVRSSALAKFDNKEHLIEKDYYTDIDSLYRKSTDKYDVHDRKIEEYDVSYPFHASYQEAYSDENIEVKDSMGDCYKYKYDNTGNLVEKIKESFSGSNRTIDKITDYKYDSNGNKIEEDNFEHFFRNYYVTFYIGGKEFTSKTIFKYDDHSRLTESDEYFQEKSDLTPKQHSGILIGGKDLYTYDSQSNKTDSVTFMWIYQEADSSITTGSQTTSQMTENKETEEYDIQGNVIKKLMNNTVTLWREIEYF